MGRLLVRVHIGARIGRPRAVRTLVQYHPRVGCLVFLEISVSNLSHVQTVSVEL